MAAAPRFPPFFPPVFSTVGGEGEERQCLCSEKADLTLTCIVASLRMRKYTFFYHKFVLQGVFSKGNDCKSYIGISVYILSGAHGLPIGLPTFFNRFDTRAHE